MALDIEDPAVVLLVILFSVVMIVVMVAIGMCAGEQITMDKFKQAGVSLVTTKTGGHETYSYSTNALAR